MIYYYWLSVKKRFLPTKTNTKAWEVHMVNNSYHWGKIPHPKQKTVCACERGGGRENVQQDGWQSLHNEGNSSKKRRFSQYINVSLCIASDPALFAPLHLTPTHFASLMKKKIHHYVTATKQERKSCRIDIHFLAGWPKAWLIVTFHRMWVPHWNEVPR